jgi:Rrf2 family protein
MSRFMRMSEGVEWALHCCLTLSWIESDRPAPSAKLAAIFDLPAPYLNKRLQALVRADILVSTPGVHGGFGLARPPEKITLMDVVTAIEGAEPAFRCTDIRRRGAGAERPAHEFQRQCVVDTAMRKAELAWRRALAGQTVADLLASAPSCAAERTRDWFAAAG